MTSLWFRRHNDVIMCVFCCLQLTPVGHPKQPLTGLVFVITLTITWERSTWHCPMTPSTPSVSCVQGTLVTAKKFLTFDSSRCHVNQVRCALKIFIFMLRISQSLVVFAYMVFAMHFLETNTSETSITDIHQVLYLKMSSAIWQLLSLVNVLIFVIKNNGLFKLTTKKGHQNTHYWPFVRGICIWPADSRPIQKASSADIISMTWYPR